MVQNAKFLVLVSGFNLTPRL